MLSRTSSLCFVSILVLLAGFSTLAAENTSTPVPLEPEAVRAASDAAPAGEVDLEWLRNLEPEKALASGCYAEQRCEGTSDTVSCTANSGTCSNSTQGCGRVTCNGQGTQCPGACYGDHHCAVYCDWQPNSYCRYGCCRCVP